MKTQVIINIDYAEDDPARVQRQLDNAKAAIYSVIGDGILTAPSHEMEIESYTLSTAIVREDASESEESTAPDLTEEQGGSKTLYMEAYAVDDFADGPGYAEYPLTPGKLAQIVALQQLCVEHGLSECRQWDGLDWEREEELGLTGHELVVDKTSFWFTAHPKHANHIVETRAMAIRDLEMAYGSDEVVIYAGNDPGELKRLIADACIEEVVEQG